MLYITKMLKIKETINYCMFNEKIYFLECKAELSNGMNYEFTFKKEDEKRTLILMSSRPMIKDKYKIYSGYEWEQFIESFKLTKKEEKIITRQILTSPKLRIKVLF